MTEPPNPDDVTFGVFEPEQVLRSDTQPPMIVLRPGDRVLLAIADEPSDDDRKAMLAGLRDSFPGVEFVIATGIAGVLVQALPAC
ncbi:hypothetical protein [Actinomadura decatromicini]|uniref:Uncharacterized protein n=1 Tax=Actinomadura decatromicini TaxID=2604572 RepID=A0A5D3FCW9_9ACTN|nr:hypothetical protein [Actinomadura decatromicini]TYK45165.1 hypothetical protein FXF68_31295 [Actinomadura decatromicini]